MKSSKNIKVYGTLVNHTLDSTLADETHNDALMNAYQLFDGRFGDSPLSNNFQDVINKRITDITFDGGTTTIENREPVTENHYTLVVNGDTNLNGDVHITEDLHVDGDTHLGDTYIDGSLYVTGQTDLTLGDLGNVNKNADSASAGTFLKYNGTEWLPVSIALSDVFGNIGNAFEGAILKYKSGAWTFDTNELNKLADVDISNIQEGSILKWDASANKWKMSSDASGDALPQGTEGYILKYVGGEWKAQPYVDLVGATRMSELNDVDTTGLAVGMILKWNGTNWYVTGETGGGTQLPAGSEGKVLKYKNGAWTADDDLVGATKLSDLSDVDSSVDSADAGAVLTYDSESGKWKAINEEGGLSIIPLDATYHYYNLTYTYLTTISAQVARDTENHGFGAITNSSVDDVAGFPMYEKDYYYVYVLNSQDKALIPSNELLSGVEYTNIDVDNLPHSVYPSGVSTYPINNISYTNNVNGSRREGSYTSSTYFVPSNVYDTITPNIISGGVHKPGIFHGLNNTNSSISLHLENGLTPFSSIKAKVVNDYGTIGDDAGSYYGNVISFVKDGYSYGIFTTGGYVDYAQPLGFTSRFYKCLTTSNATAINRTYTSITESDFKAAASGFTIPAGASYIIVGPVAQKPADTIIEKITTYESGDMGFTDVGKGLLVGEIVAGGIAADIGYGYYYMAQITKNVAERIISMSMTILEDGNPVNSTSNCALLVSDNNYYLYGTFSGSYTLPDRSLVSYNGDKALFRVLLKK